jgi:16S rRNA processing protein RimM
MGQVAGAFGVHGELRLTAYTAEPAALMAYGPLLGETGEVVLTLVSGRAEKGVLIARAEEVATREEAKALAGLRLFVERASLPAPAEEEYYLADLIGLAAVSPAGAPLGRVRSVQDFGAGDLLEIAPDDGSPTWWAPFTREVAVEVRLAEGVIVIDRPAED